MDDLDRLEANSIYIIREAQYQFKNIALLWSIGKDSTTLLWLCRKAFFGKLPFPVVHIDTGCKFEEIYKFRDEHIKKWGLDLIVVRNEEAIARGVSPEDGKFECCNALKTVALQQAIVKHGFDALIVGIRRDEHGIRAKERLFSPRNLNFQWDYKNQPLELWEQYASHQEDTRHIRVHPLLGWTEVDVWRYVQRENMPVTDLYFARDGERYRSIGCQTCCLPVSSEASNVDEIVAELKTTKASERSGRAQDKESEFIMQQLRTLGYM